MGNNEIYEKATKYGNIASINNISDRQIALLKKISEREASSKDVKEYVTLLLKDNMFNSFSLPQIDFKMIGDSGGSSIDDQITVSTKLISMVLENNVNIIFAIDIVGHELRHFLQQNTTKDEQATEQGREKIDRLNEKGDSYITGTNRISIDIISSNKSKQPLKKFFQEFSDKPLAIWYNSIPDEEKRLIGEQLSYSKYVKTFYEEDARAAAIVWDHMVLDKYLSDYRICQDKKLVRWLKKVKESLECIHSTYDIVLEAYDYIEKFEEAVLSVDVEFIKNTCKYISENNLYGKNKKDTNKDPIVAILDIAAEYYCNSLTKEKQKALFDECLGYMDEPRIKNGKVNPRRIFAKYMLLNIVYGIQNTSDDVIKFSEDITAKTLAIAKTRELDELDSNTFTFYYEEICREPMQKQFHNFFAEGDGKRKLELAKMIDIKTIYYSEMDDFCLIEDEDLSKLCLAVSLKYKSTMEAVDYCIKKRDYVKLPQCYEMLNIIKDDIFFLAERKLDKDVYEGLPDDKVDSRIQYRSVCKMSNINVLEFEKNLKTVKNNCDKFCKAGRSK